MLDEHSKYVLATLRTYIQFTMGEKQRKLMLKKGIVFCFALIIMGTLDWATTVTGTLCFGAIEINPLFAELTQNNILLFSWVKLAAVILVGTLFYKADKRETIMKSGSYLGKHALESGYALSLMVLTFAVTNNMIAVAGAI